MTVPKRPMNGVADAVVARNESPRVEAGRLDAGRALQRALDRVEALHEEATRVGGRHFAAVLHLLVQLGVARAEDPDERAGLAAVADAEHVGELAALAEVARGTRASSDAAREKLQSLPMMIAHDTSEKNARTSEDGLGRRPAVEEQLDEVRSAGFGHVCSFGLPRSGMGSATVRSRPSRQGSTETRSGQSVGRLCGALAAGSRAALRAAPAAGAPPRATSCRSRRCARG